MSGPLARTRSGPRALLLRRVHVVLASVLVDQDDHSTFVVIAPDQHVAVRGVSGEDRGSVRDSCRYRAAGIQCLGEHIPGAVVGSHESAPARSLASTWTSCGSVIVRWPSRSRSRRALMIVTPMTWPSSA